MATQSSLCNYTRKGLWLIISFIQTAEGQFTRKSLLGNGSQTWWASTPSSDLACCDMRTPHSTLDLLISGRTGSQRLLLKSSPSWLLLLFSWSIMFDSLWPHELYSMPGLPVLHHLLEFAQIHVHWVNDAIQLSHSLSSPSPAFNLSQPQGIF